MLKLHILPIFLLTVFSYVSFLDSFIEVLNVFCSNCYSNPWVWWTNDKPSCFHPAFAKTLTSSSYILLHSSITCLFSLRIILLSSLFTLVICYILLLSLTCLLSPSLHSSGFTPRLSRPMSLSTLMKSGMIMNTPIIMKELRVSLPPSQPGHSPNR